MNKITILPLSRRDKSALSGILQRKGFHEGVTEYSKFDGSVPFNRVDSPTFHLLLNAYKTVYAELDCVIEQLEPADMARYSHIKAQHKHYKILTAPALNESIQCSRFHTYRQRYLKIHDAFLGYLVEELETPLA
ncbi:MAG: hypothetical protein RSD49_16340 [Hafnia sp.]